MNDKELGSRFVKRPVEVTALQWTGRNKSELVEFTGHQFETVNPVLYGGFTGQVYDELHETWVSLRTGDWAVRGVRGEFYPVAGAVFEDTYDAVVGSLGKEVADAALDTVMEWFPKYLTPNDPSTSQLRVRPHATKRPGVLLGVEECDPTPTNLRYFRVTLSVHEDGPDKEEEAS